MHPSEQRELERYFGPAQGAQGKSTFGPILDRQATHYRDSAGRVIDARRIVVATRELAERAPDGAPMVAQVLTPWPYMPVRREQSTGGVEPEDRDEDLQLLARVGRRLAQLTPEARLVLELLYGDHGCRWAREAQGRIWALVPGQGPARRALERDDRERSEKGRPVAVLTAAERLATLALVRPRPVWVDAALDLAERLQGRSESAWEASTC